VRLDIPVFFSPDTTISLSAWILLYPSLIVDQTWVFSLLIDLPPVFLAQRGLLSYFFRRYRWGGRRQRDTPDEESGPPPSFLPRSQSVVPFLLVFVPTAWPVA